VGSHLHAMGEPPVWLGKIIGREDRLFSDRSPTGSTSISLTKRQGVVKMFGEFTTPPGRAGSCMPGCPEPLHFTFLRVTVDPRSHRVVSVLPGHQIEGSQAVRIARASDRYLRIFSPTPGKIRCSIPKGGLQLRGTPGFSGRCTTEYVASGSLHGRAIRIRFGERWHSDHHLQIAAWVVTVAYRDGRVLSTRVIGEPPQLWK
jgi:hypothetical protein